MHAVLNSAHRYERELSRGLLKQQRGIRCSRTKVVEQDKLPATIWWCVECMHRDIRSWPVVHCEGIVSVAAQRIEDGGEEHWERCCKGAGAAPQILTMTPNWSYAHRQEASADKHHASAYLLQSNASYDSPNTCLGKVRGS